ncbi:MAG TPA: sensor histidine kinase [Elainellaceae cyanobacterium]
MNNSLIHPNQQDLILIVDDNATNIRVLFDVLHESGYRILVARSGKSAIAKLQAITPDLIILDVVMSDIDGFETCRLLKAAPSTRDIPIIFMTALSDAVDKVKGLNLGAVDYITKPFQRDEVLARIDVHLKLHHLNRELEKRVANRTTELTTALEKLQQSQLQLVQSEKMSALGQLIAGIAHEVNNPVNFIQNNLAYIDQYIQELIHYIQLSRNQAPPALLDQHAANIDLDYLLDDLPHMLESMQVGTERIANISVSLRTFSRGDAVSATLFDVHEGIDSTLLILRHRLQGNETRPAIQVIKNYGTLPKVECFPGQLNQVFMNLLANAIDALEDASEGRLYDELERYPNQITIQTRLIQNQNFTAIAPSEQTPTSLSQWVQICIRDNGAGIAEDIKPSIFDYLFTTKPVGNGTGLGLSIARQIIVEKHGGHLDVNSEWGQGAEFIIIIPTNVPY